jgi:hypothetical protein
MAESFLQPLVTMLRRNFRFRQTGYVDSSILGYIESGQINQQWRTWIDQESFRRLVYAVLQHDSDSSMALLVAPLISYAEVSLPLPCADNIWAASSPEQWKTALTLLSPSKPLTLDDCLGNAELIMDNRSAVDTKAVSLACLSCAWRLSWDFFQLGSLRRACPRRLDGLLMKYRRDELLKLLGHYRTFLDFASTSTLEINIRLELVHLHIHMPFGDIQVFAGMEGPEQARAMQPVIAEWAGSEEARRAVFHAGQIIRMAKLLPQTMLHGPLSIIVYHASLALWVYGLLSPSSEEQRHQLTNPHSTNYELAPRVWLDEGEDISLERFIQYGRGNPCIRGHMVLGSPPQTPDDVCLFQSNKVMEAVVGIFHGNFHARKKPPLVEKLIQLITELGKSSDTAGGLRT